MQATLRAVVIATVMGTFSTFLLVGGALAQSADTKENLVADWQKYQADCTGVTSTQCSSNLAQLKDRQKKLNLSDADLNSALLNFRGGVR